MAKLQFSNIVVAKKKRRHECDAFWAFDYALCSPGLGDVATTFTPRAITTHFAIGIIRLLVAARLVHVGRDGDDDLRRGSRRHAAAAQNSGHP